MKYIIQIEINKPINRVVELFDNPANMKHWMEGLQSFESISGKPGWPGARSRLKFRMGNRSMDMIETVTVRNLPHEFTGTYEMKGAVNIVKNKFERVNDTTTRYISEQEFRFKGMMRLIAMIMPGAFSKQSMKYLENFKNFVERS